MLVMVPIVLLINGFTKGDWLEAFLFALSVAVGLTPEMLPMIVTSTLAKGAVALSRKKVIVKRLDAIQNFGAMDVLCTDKTGTLTQDQIVLERHIDTFGRTDRRGAGLRLPEQPLPDRAEEPARPRGARTRRPRARTAGGAGLPQGRRDSVRLRAPAHVGGGRERDDHHELICKGAVEEVLAVCTPGCAAAAQAMPLTPRAAGANPATTTGAPERGGPARGRGGGARPAADADEVYGVADEADLMLIGYIAFLDPPKESAAPALAALAAHGVTVKVLTGDNELVTAKVCREVGLPVAGVLLGAAGRAHGRRRAGDGGRDDQVFAKLSPAHKERIVRALRANGHVVGFMGDGINDAPALRAADIGISVDTRGGHRQGGGRHHPAREEPDGAGGGRGRRAHDLRQHAQVHQMTASSNFGNVFSVLVASAFLPFLPMLPLQLLVQNLLYDISQIGDPVRQRRRRIAERSRSSWNPGDIGRFMLFFGPISSVFDITTFCVMWLVFGANTLARRRCSSPAGSSRGCCTQTLIVHMIRTRKMPFLQSRASWPLIGMTTLIMTLGIALPMGPLAPYFKLQALPLAYFPWLLAIMLAYMLLTQAMKGWYARRYGWQ